MSHWSKVILLCTALLGVSACEPVAENLYFHLQCDVDGAVESTNEVFSQAFMAHQNLVSMGCEAPFPHGYDSHVFISTCGAGRGDLQAGLSGFCSGELIIEEITAEAFEAANRVTYLD